MGTRSVIICTYLFLVSYREIKVAGFILILIHLINFPVNFHTSLSSHRCYCSKNLAISLSSMTEKMKLLSENNRHFVL